MISKKANAYSINNEIKRKYPNLLEKSNEKKCYGFHSFKHLIIILRLVQNLSIGQKVNFNSSFILISLHYLVAIKRKQTKIPLYKILELPVSLILKQSEFIEIIFDNILIHFLLESF